MSKSIIAFIAGGIVGAVASALYFKDKYRKIADEEIKSVKEVYTVPKQEKSEEKTEEKSDKEPEKDEEVIKPKTSINQYREIMRKQGYIGGSYKKPGEPDDEEDDDNIKEDLDRPYVISPDEYGDKYGADNCYILTYYADGVLEDEDGELIDDVDEIVGRESLETFGEYEEDMVYVRNDVRRADYEIERDLNKYYNGR